MQSKTNIVDCEGLLPEVTLAHIYNYSEPSGMGIYQAKEVPMTVNEAKEVLESYGDLSIEYLYGRPIKLSFDKYPLLDAYEYDRNNGGMGTMSKIIDELKRTGEICMDVKFNLKNNNSVETLNSKLDSIKLSSKSVKELPELKRFNTVRFKESYNDFLKKQGVSNLNRFYVFMGIFDDKAEFVGSIGGRISIPIDMKCIEHVDHQMGI